MRNKQKHKIHFTTFLLKTDKQNRKINLEYKKVKHFYHLVWLIENYNPQ